MSILAGRYSQAASKGVKALLMSSTSEIQLLPTRATLDDIKIVCFYLAKKPAGVTIADASAVVGEGALRKEKLDALRFWGADRRRRRSNQAH